MMVSSVLFLRRTAAGMVLALAGPVGAVQAATLSTLHAFTGSDGAFPAAGVIRDAQGNLYGTTELGAASNAGTVFTLTPGGSLTYFSFTNANGASPAATLVRDGKGNLYGTTFAGGAYTDCGSGNGCGTAFKLAPGGTLSTLHSFDGTDGTFTYAKIVRNKGNIFGTVFEGVSGYGAVFELSRRGVETGLYKFQGHADGAYPKAGVIQDRQGNLYGETYGGGTGGASGTVFEIAASGGETVLYSFQGGSDGVKPSGGLIRDANGNFYGTTEQGGASGLGTVFMLTPGGTETLLHSFAGGGDGASPRAGVLLKGGKLYGTTYEGGASNDGTVFEIALKNFAETVLYAFSGADGANPDCTLVADKSGNLYGTTFHGGGTSNDGTVFELTPQQALHQQEKKMTTNRIIPPAAGLAISMFFWALGFAADDQAAIATEQSHQPLPAGEHKVVAIYANTGDPYQQLPLGYTKVDHTTVTCPKASCTLVLSGMQEIVSADSQGEWQIYAQVDGHGVDAGVYQGYEPVPNFYLTGNWQGKYTVSQGVHTIDFETYLQVSVILVHWSDTVMITTP